MQFSGALSSVYINFVCKATSLQCEMKARSGNGSIKRTCDFISTSETLRVVCVCLTNDGVDVLGRVFSKSADAGTLGRHREAGQRPLAVHVLTNHGANLANTGQSVGGKEGKETLTLMSRQNWEVELGDGVPELP